MKLRLKDQTVRLRLGEADIDAIRTEARVHATTRYGREPDARITFGIEVTQDAGEITVRADPHGFTVLVPQGIASDWLSTDREGFEAHLPIDNGEHLYLIVQKDFPCLHGAETSAGENPSAKVAG